MEGVAGETGAARDRARREVAYVCRCGLPAAELLRRTLRVIHRVMPFDASSWNPVDPATLLPIGGLVHNVPPEACPPYFDHELLVPDVDKFATLARQRRPVGILSRATAGVPQRSARYRLGHDVFGDFDELRVAFVHDGACWGYAALLRQRSWFSPPEAAFVADVAGEVAAGLRRAVLRSDPELAGGVPGTVLVSPAGQVEAATPEAEHWMSELTALTERSDQQPRTPPAVYIVAARARAALGGRDDGLPRARLRTQAGQWLTLHASSLAGPDGTDGRVAVVIEPAHPTEIAPIVMAAYGLTDRERQVLRLVAQGLSTERIARTLFLSPHTVRDYLKALFAKVGAGSRGELVARVFADHYLPRLADTETTAG